MNESNQKQNRAVLVRVVSDESGVRLSVDDVINTGATCYILDCHVTHQFIEIDDLKDINMAEKEIADFGYYILSRISAMANLNELF